MKSSFWPTVWIVVITALLAGMLFYRIGQNSVIPGTETQIVYQQTVDTTYINVQRKEIARLQRIIDNQQPVTIYLPGETTVDTLLVYPVVKDSIVTSPYGFRHKDDVLTFNSRITTTMTYSLYTDDKGEYYRKYDHRTVVDGVSYEVIQNIIQPPQPGRFVEIYGMGGLVWDEWKMQIELQAIFKSRYLFKVGKTEGTTNVSVGYRIF